MLELPPITSGQPLLDVIHHTDLLTLCGALPPQSVDMILCDLPYGITSCHWDSVIPLEPMWCQFKRVIKPRGAIVLTASQPFTSKLVMSNPEMFRYEWIWDKHRTTGFFNADYQPQKQHEEILIFSNFPAVYTINGSVNFYAQMEESIPYHINPNLQDDTPVYRGKRLKERQKNNGIRYPKSIIRTPSIKPLFGNGETTLHPTQKPVALFEYLIRTYTQPGEIVLDPCIGSGTTALAARQTGRHFIGGDITLEYVNIARARLAKPYTPPMFLEEAHQPKAANLSLFADVLA